MKRKGKLIAVLLCFFVFGVLALGSGSSDDSGEAGSSASVSTEEKSADVTVEEQTIVDESGVTVTVTGIDTDGFYGAELKLAIENNTGQNLTISARDMSINGVMIEPYLAEEVAAGKKANATLDIFSSNLKAAGITTIQEIELKIAAYDTENWEDLFETDAITIKTSAAGTFEQTYNDDGETLYEDERFRIVALELDSDDSFWGADIYLYIENNSGQDITVQSRDVSINGYMVDPMFSCDVLNGKKAFDTITFLESDLEDNGIEKIETLELKLHIYNEDSWDTLLDTDAITVNFD